MVRIPTLALPLAVSLALVGCTIHTYETPQASMTSTTRATNATVPAPEDPHFRVSDEIYARCGIGNQPTADVAASTAYCMRTGALNDNDVRIMGSKSEVDRARDRLVGNGIDVNRMVIVYSSGPATIDVVERTLGKQHR